MDERKGYIFDQKNALRKRMLAVRKSVTDKTEKSRAVCDAIIPMLRGNCLVYVSIGSELRTDKLIADMLGMQNICVYAPYTVDGIIYPRKAIKLGIPDRYGNMPRDCYDFGDTEKYVRPAIDVCVTPLVAFNGDGYRLGYGKGCYDRYFSSAENMLKVGVAFSEQFCEFSHEDCDVPLDCCITERGVIYFSHENNIG